MNQQVRCEICGNVTTDPFHGCYVPEWLRPTGRKQQSHFTVCFTCGMKSEQRTSARGRSQ